MPNSRNKGDRAQMGLIAPSLEQTQVPIDSVKPHPDNDNEGDVEFIKESIKANGMYAPIVIQASTRHIVKGNHTWLACLALEYPTIAAVELDITDDQALAIMEMDNESSRRSTFNAEVRRKNLKRLAKATGVMEYLPLFAEWSQDQREAMDGATAIDAQATGNYAETPEQYAARAAHEPKQSSTSAQGFKEVVLMFKQDDYVAFQARCEEVKKAAKLHSNTDVVNKAVKEVGVGIVVLAMINSLTGDEAGAMVDPPGDQVSVAGTGQPEAPAPSLVDGATPGVDERDEPELADHEFTSEEEAEFMEMLLRDE